MIRNIKFNQLISIYFLATATKFLQNNYRINLIDKIDKKKRKIESKSHF